MAAPRSEKSLSMTCSVERCSNASICKSRCKKHYDQWYRQQNKEKIAIQLKNYQIKNKEKIKSWYKEWAKGKGKDSYLNRRNKENYRKWRREYQKRPKIAKNHLDNCNRRKLDKIKRTPKWGKKQAIKQFYLNCPKGYHVDHIIPLCGRLVSGLHVLNNLQYLSAGENSAKGNRFEPYTGYKPGDVMYVGN